jgi:hypothetical protein
MSRPFMPVPELTSEMKTTAHVLDNGYFGKNQYKFERS